MGFYRLNEFEKHESEFTHELSIRENMHGLRFKTADAVMQVARLAGVKSYEIIYVTLNDDGYEKDRRVFYTTADVHEWQKIVQSQRMSAMAKKKAVLEKLEALPKQVTLFNDGHLRIIAELPKNLDSNYVQHYKYGIERIELDGNHVCEDYGVIVGTRYNEYNGRCLAKKFAEYICKVENEKKFRKLSWGQERDAIAEICTPEYVEKWGTLLKGAYKTLCEINRNVDRIRGGL